VPRVRPTLWLTALLVMTGCVAVDAPVNLPPASLVDSTGRTIGSVTIAQTSGGVSLTISASGIPHGLHAVHVHSIGRCDLPSFESAGTHWNPAGRDHGLNNPSGPHAGDLPSVPASSSGVVAETLVLGGTSFAALSDADGSALIIHADADDNITNPSGNSGARIACAILARPAED